ncbi:MAG: hypothetical protein GTO63_22240 [Anaerolineae bacterium]|nr:hypothetical protein [Anaerolineae bacterium]NIN97501.1 hypothetical protein [Anaerolineae bacterium]NIQ80430.1 hypothetical protein [Anaerolineae bacterium]
MPLRGCRAGCDVCHPVAQVPTQGVFTSYSVIGDLFGWSAVIGFVAIIVLTLARRRRARRSAPRQVGG